MFDIEKLRNIDKLHNFGPFQQGSACRVKQAFVDAEGVEHPEDERRYHWSAEYDRRTGRLVLSQFDAARQEYSVPIDIGCGVNPRHWNGIFELYEPATIELPKPKPVEACRPDSPEWEPSLNFFSQVQTTDIRGGTNPDWKQIEARVEEAVVAASAGRYEEAARLLSTIDRAPDPNGWILQSLAAMLESHGAANDATGYWMLLQAERRWSWWASGATSGGEGAARMLEVNRVRKRLGMK